MKSTYSRFLCIVMSFAILIASLPLTSGALTFSDISAPDPNTYSADGVYVIAEDTAKRNEFEKHYLLSDGSMIAVSYAEAVHYLDDNGEWDDVDNRFSYETKTGKYVSNTPGFSVSFAQNANSAELVRIDGGSDREFAWALDVETVNDYSQTTKSTASSLSVDKASITISTGDNSFDKKGKEIADADAFDLPNMSGRINYSQLFSKAPEISANYTVYHNKIEEDIYINSPTGARSFIMSVASDGLEAVVNEDRSVSFVNEDGVEEYKVGIPYMVDASDEVLNDITVETTEKSGVTLIKYIPNEEWLTSSERTYPIMFDPAITTAEYNSNIEDTYVMENDTAVHSSQQTMYVGIKSGNICRSYIKVNSLPEIDATMPILSATMTLSLWIGTSTGRDVSVYRLWNGWSDDTITYATQPTLTTLLAQCEFDSSDLHYTFDLTENVSELYDEYYAAVNYGYMIRYTDESKTNPDYNALYTSEWNTSIHRPVMQIVYGYALPSTLTEGGIYSFLNCGSLKFMTVHGGTDANGTNVYQYDGDIDALGVSQKFKLEKVESTGGYILRAMCSSNGTNRVLDIVKSGGYVTSGGNVQIYQNNDPIAQEWFIVGVGSLQFKLVPRTNMSLALTAHTSNDNGTSTGTTSTSAGNIFVSTYDENNTYQRWYIVENGDFVDYYGNNDYSTGIYYINNNDIRKYLHTYGNILDCTSGMIADLEDEIRWKLTVVGEDRYTISSVEAPSMYLGRLADATVGLVSVSSATDISDSVIWNVELDTSLGGTSISYQVEIDGEVQTRYLQGYPTGVLTTTNVDDDNVSWAFLSIDYYGDGDSYTMRELSSMSFDTIYIDEGENKTISYTVSPENALWCDYTDFTYSSNNTQVANYGLGGQIVGLGVGTARITVTHKATGASFGFNVEVGSPTFTMRIYTSPWSLDNFGETSYMGHSWVTVTNHSNYNLQFGYYTVTRGQTITIALYGSKFKDDLDKEMTPVDFDGVWYNRDIFEIVNNSKYEQVVYLEECVAKNSASLLSNKIIDKNFAYNLYTYNCVHFAVELWNLVVSSDKRIDTCLTPDNLETEINKQSGAVSISSGHLADLPVNTCSYYDGSVLQSYTFRGEEQ